MGWEDTLFRQGLIVPVVFICCFITAFSLFLNIIVGSVVLSLMVIFWGTVAYVFISRKMKAFYKEFEKEKAREKESTK